MITAKKFCLSAGITHEALTAWVEAGWISPDETSEGWQLSSIDLARARLILDLHGPMGVNDEGIALVLHLLDQIHGLRRALKGAHAGYRQVTITSTSGPGAGRSRRNVNEADAWEE
jgi:chaperone modulatory protein CbpM